MVVFYTVGIVLIFLVVAICVAAAVVAAVTAAVSAAVPADADTSRVCSVCNCIMYVRTIQVLTAKKGMLGSN